MHSWRRLSSSFADWVTHFGIAPTGVLHVGGHLAEEAEAYGSLEFEPVIWVEALPDIAEQAAARIKKFSNQKVICATLGSTSGQELTFYRAGNEGSSSSLLEPHLIMAAHPEVQVSQETKVITKTMDELFQDLSNFKFLCLDVQGAELEVLKGASRSLKVFDYIMSEVSIRQLYKGAPLFKDITNFLSNAEFVLAASKINSTTGWGDALYIRRNIYDDLDNTKKLETHERSRQGVGLFTQLRGVLIKFGLKSKWLNPAAKFRSR